MRYANASLSRNDVSLQRHLERRQESRDPVGLNIRLSM